MSARTFKWTVEIEVSEAGVADGLDFNQNNVEVALLRAFPYMSGAHIAARVLKSPSPESIAIARGEYKRLGWVHDAVGRAHVLVNIRSTDIKPEHARLLCDAHLRHSPLPVAETSASMCPECKRRDES